MRWMLAGGAALFALIVAGVLTIMMGGGGAPPVVAPPVAEAPPAEEEKVPDATLTDVEFLTAAEPLAEKFLAARGVDELLPFVRNPDVCGPRLRAMYPDGTIEAPGMSAFDTNREVVRTGKAMSVIVRTDDLELKTLSFFMTPDGLKIDWESWVGWSEIPWEVFTDTKPVSAKMFRVWLSPVDYYNFGFSDDLKWQSYLLESPDGNYTLYAYVERGSVLDSRLKPSPDVKKTPLTLMLSFPDDAASSNQVLVEKFVAEGWMLETEESP